MMTREVFQHVTEINDEGDKLDFIAAIGVGIIEQLLDMNNNLRNITKQLEKINANHIQ